MTRRGSTAWAAALRGLTNDTRVTAIPVLAQRQGRVSRLSRPLKAADAAGTAGTAGPTRQRHRDAPLLEPLVDLRRLQPRHAAQLLGRQRVELQGGGREGGRVAHGSRTRRLQRQGGRKQ